MRHPMLFLMVILCSFYSCNDIRPVNSAQSTQASGQIRSKLRNQGTDLLASMIKNYYDLKNALVKDDGAAAEKSAEKMISSAHELRSQMLADSIIHKKELLTYLDSIINGNQQITIKNKNCELKRIDFSVVSESLYALIKLADLKNMVIYRQYCPMAFNDKGAYWLSNTTTIKNPYFGKKMLESGEIIEIIK